jgi:methionyl-tRNA formyltransferase
MGTPAFAVSGLKAIVEEGHDVVAVVTAPDRPAGRGLKPLMSDVKMNALSLGLFVMQPEKLRDEEFRQQIQIMNPDIIVVIAFRMLPKSIWGIPAYGTFNLHASLLPAYRGAAPIHHAVMNGETKTGLTTFLIDDKIDTGNILLQHELVIYPMETTGELHDRMLKPGAELVVKTIDALISGTAKPISQDDAMKSLGIRPSEAPKLFRETGKIDWLTNPSTLHNKIRGLSPYPGAWSPVIDSNGNQIEWKILRSELTNSSELQPGHIFSPDGKSLYAGTANGDLKILEIQPSGKKRMHADEFLRGFKNVPFVWTGFEAHT